MHQDKINHATLASDMMEEWRAIIVDSTVLSIIQGNEISSDLFYYKDDNCMMTREGLNIFIEKLEKKMYTKVKYLTYLNNSVDFRKAIWYQCESLAKMIDNNDLNLYTPIMVR